MNDNTNSKIRNCLSIDTIDPVLEFIQFGISIGCLGGGAEEKQTHDHIYKSQPQVLSSKSDLKIPDLGINIYKIIDPTE